MTNVSNNDSVTLQVQQNRNEIKESSIWRRTSWSNSKRQEEMVQTWLMCY